MLKNNIVFLKEFLAEFEATGSFFPSSRWAAEGLIHPLRQPREIKKIIEVGPGSGPVTIHILEQMIEGDKLVLCEINPRFMAALKKNLSGNPLFQKHQANIEFFEGPVQALQTTDKFDVIVCAVPFLNLDKAVVADIFEKLKELSSDSAVMTYFEYIGLRKIGQVVSPPERRRRLKELESFFDDVFREHNMRRQRVWLNVLPINIYTLKMDTSESSDPVEPTDKAA